MNTIQRLRLFTRLLPIWTALLLIGGVCARRKVKIEAYKPQSATENTVSSQGGVTQDMLRNATISADLRLAVKAILAGKQVNVNEKFGGGNTLLHLASDQAAPITELLLKKGADPNVPNDYPLEEYPLHQAVKFKKLDVVKALIMKGKADPNLQNRDGDTPLHLAANLELLKMVEALLAGGAKLDIPNRGGNTPLKRAKVSGNKEIIALMEGGS